MPPFRPFQCSSDPVIEQLGTQALLLDGERHRSSIQVLEHSSVSVLGVLERAPPELCADIVDKGIVLTGGGAQLANLDVLLSEQTGLPVFLSDEPEFAVVLGSGAALDELDLLREVALD